MKISAFNPVGAIQPVSPVSVRPELANAQMAPLIANDQGTTPQQVARFTSALIQQSKTLSQRDLIISSTALQSKAIKLGELYQLLMGSQDQHLDAAVRNLRRELMLQATNTRVMDVVLNAAGGDAARAHVMLQAAARQADNEGASDEHQLLARQLKVLRHQQGGRARAGINTARAIARSSINPRRRQTLRDLYYTGVVGQHSIAGLIDNLLGQDDAEHPFEPTLRDLRSAIADDLAAFTPSSTRQHLRTLMHGLNTARHVATLVHTCEHLLGRMRSKNPTLQINAPTFLKHLLALSGNGMHLHDTLQLAQFIGGPQLKHQLSFLNGLRPMLQQLPIVLWKDLKARQNALGNLLTLMAELTQQEQNLARGKPA